MTRSTDFFRRWYRPATMVVTAAGRLEHDQIVEAVASGLGDGVGGDLPARTPPAAPVERVIVERDDTEQAHLCLGWRSLSTGDDDRWAMSVANQVLGGGMASRLFQEVREAARSGVLRLLAPHRLRGLRVPHDLLRHRTQAGRARRSR